MRKWFDACASAWVGIATHKLRSFLTILGIVIGVSAVIALMSIGKGAQADILSRIESIGADRITIRPGATMGFGGVRGAMGSGITLTLEDAEAIASQVAGVETVVPTYQRQLQLVVREKNTNANVIGVTPQYQGAYNLDISSGTFFSDYDYDRGANVAVLGSNIATTLFPDGSAVGQQVRMGNSIVFVAGVLLSKGAMAGSTDDAILIPLTAMQALVAQPRTAQGDRIVSSIELTVAEQSEADRVVEDITALLRIRHRLGATAENDFIIRSMADIAETLSQTTGTMTLLLGAIAAISLLVGGIGVMNIMLISVLERTREIGIRKALGARERDIWVQFLLEAAFLTFVGGITGIAVGWATSFGVSSMGQISSKVTADIVILAVAVSVGIGLFFGFYPAWSASRLNPIAALRSE